VKGEGGEVRGRKHHELLVWQAGINLVCDVYQLTQGFPKEEKFGLSSQMRRAVVSVPSNIAEGAARSSHKEFLHFLFIARGSLSELETQLIISQRLQYCSQVESTMEKIDTIFGLLGGLMNSLKKVGQ
jgi:four helix bundle protein